jgi:Family of unknown function (DUF5996)
MDRNADIWPDLSYPSWRTTVATLHLWTQIIGKIRLSLTPWINHGWQVPLYVTARGLGTGPVPFGHEIVEAEFDFIAHCLQIRTSQGAERRLALAPQSVADFYLRVLALLREVGVSVSINEVPSELVDPVVFSRDRIHADYDAAAVHRFWRALVQVDRVFKHFRSGFLGKASPVHFFWGGFDLAVTRFSGRPAPRHPGGVPGLADAVVREAYSHEVSSAGFWPGNDAFPRAAFYSYAYPEPDSFSRRPVSAGAYYDGTLREFILPYDQFRTTADPDAVLLEFLATTYAAAAEGGGWDRARLECAMGMPRRIRPLS